MILRLHIFLAGCLALLLAALLAIAPAQAKPASGGYQLLGGAASGHQADIPLAALGNFDYFAKIAPECCNAPNTGTVTRVGDGPLPTGRQSLDPTEISFSQATVSGRTSDGIPHSDLVASMRRDGWQGDPVDVVNMPGGAPTSMDNRRLLAARQAGIPIQANVRNASDPLTPAQADRFEVGGQRPTTWGEAIQLQTQRQGGMPGVDPSWPERFPHGSIYDPNIVGGQ